MSGVNKVIFAGAVLLDLTSDTVTEDVIIDGYTGHDAAGNKITGKLKIITVDEALDADSTNPLQNKAIVSALAGKLSTTGNAASATKLTTSNGTATKPVYFSEGKPVACTYSLNADVPSDAKFTDTVYSHPNNHPASMITGLSAVATSGNYNDLSNKPAIPTGISDYIIESYRNGSQWYEVYKSGKVRQGGIVSGSWAVNANGIKDCVITLLRAFSDTNYYIEGHTNRNHVHVHMHDHTSGQKTTTKAILKVNNASGNTFTASQIYWEAEGQGA